MCGYRLADYGTAAISEDLRSMSKHQIEISGRRLHKCRQRLLTIVESFVCLTRSRVQAADERQRESVPEVDAVGVDLR